ncbi:MAG: hypothetical protein K6E72_11805 [Saccharofermentans sp.]|nr:hypothetical protein [Saccharofermentans sp.]
MKTKRIIGILLAASMLIPGCNSGVKGDETAQDDILMALGNAGEIGIVTEEINAEPESYEFNPHVYSPTLAQEISQDKWDAFYNLCDALRAGENSFECSSREAYDFAMNVSTLASLFPPACL